MSRFGSASTGVHSSITRPPLLDLYQQVAGISSVICDVRESRFFRYALQVQLMRSVVLSPEAVERIDAGFLSGVRPCVLTSRIGLNSAVTDHVDPAVEARNDRYDVNGIHVVAPEKCRWVPHHTALAKP
jgi:hypothetical protein